MKALVIYRVDISEISNQGVSKKMQGHIYGLVQNGYEVDAIYLNDEGLYLNDQLLKSKPKGSVALNFFKAVTFYRAIIANIHSDDYDLVLIRHHIVLPGYLDLLRHFNKSKIVIDLPTFPYNREFRGLRGKILLWIDGRNRIKLQKYVDLILHYGLEKELFGIGCLNVSNGILPRAEKWVKKEKIEGKVQLLAVGKWAYWHGLDRVIDGISGEDEVVLNVVGEGPALDELIKRSAGKKNIVFYGSLKGEELDLLFAKADLGIGTLGIHRKGVKIDSSLKNREYCMRGLPFILGTKDKDFPEQLGFVKYFPGEGVIDVEEIRDFARESAGKGVEMVSYANRELDWAKKIKVILDAI